MSNLFALRRYAFSRTISLVPDRYLYIIVRRASDCFPPLEVQSLAHDYLSEDSPSVRHADELEFSVHRLDVSEVPFDREADKEVKTIHQREALRAGCFILFFSLLFHIYISWSRGSRESALCCSCWRRRIPEPRDSQILLGQPSCLQTSRYERGNCSGG